MFADKACRCDCGGERREVTRRHRTKVLRVAVASGTTWMRAVRCVEGSLPASESNRVHPANGVRPTAASFSFWPGSCATWSTSYRRGRVVDDVSLTLFPSHEAALTYFRYWLNELRLPLIELGTGALVQTDNVQQTVLSVYRDVLIFSREVGGRNVFTAQMRLHRQLHARVHAVEQALKQPVNLRPPWWIF